MATSLSSDGATVKGGAAVKHSGSSIVAGHSLYWEHFTVTGGEPVLMLHHGLGSIRSWRRQIDPLLGAGYDLLLYDRWGYGRSDPRPAFEPGFLKQDAEEALQLMDLLGIERAHLVGHSDGGTISLLLAAEHPDRVINLLVIAAHIYFEPKMLGGLKMIEDSMVKPPLSLALEREHGRRGQALARAWVDHWLSSSPSELDMRTQLRKITAPTLVIQGELDEHATAQHARDIAAGVQEGQVWLIPDAHHMPMHESPELFNQHMLEFLADHARR
jgi:pimeloyl-ACP methyl ester carboxylesterase